MNQSLINKEAASCRTLGSKPARPPGVWHGELRYVLLRKPSRVQMGGGAPASTLTVQKDRCPRRPAGYKMPVMVETVSELCQHGQLSEAVEALAIQLAHSDRYVPKSLFYMTLKGCVANKDLPLGRRVHALAVKGGYESDTFLCNNILRMYASHAKLQEAMYVFDMVAAPDAFTWSAIISAHVKHGQCKQAVQLYHRMGRSGVKPDGYVFVAALQACARGADLRAGQEVHADLLASGVEPNSYVCSCLVDMYAKCGSLEEAQRVFDGLADKNLITWSTMIAGYSQKGMGQEAMDLYRCMQQEGIVAVDVVTFVSLLQACASLGTLALENGRQLHAQIREQGLQAEVVVAGSLVNMYAKCGSLEDARRVFDGLGQKNVVMWNAMIGGYSHQGMGQEALRLYRDMQECGTNTPDPVTFVCLLQACASVGTLALEEGMQLHARIKEQGLQADVFVANSLVNMYAKCGSLEDARCVFDGLAEKDVVTWNAMIAGYLQQGMGQEALCLYNAMREEGIAAPDAVTFVSLLQACADVGPPALEKGKQFHAQIRERALQPDVFVANSLVHMYSKCGSLEDAQRVFDGLLQKDVVTWNAMIAGYSQKGMGHEALVLYSAMQEEGIVTPNSVTFVSLLQACASVGAPALEAGNQLHALIREQGLQEYVFVANSLLNMYAKCGSVEDAQDVFDGLAEKNVVTWNAMMAGYSQQGMGQKALSLYHEMQEQAMVAPSDVTFVCLLQACAQLGTLALETGKQLHVQIKEHGYQADEFVASSLVNMYAKCGSLVDARGVFDGLDQKNVVTWSAMIAGYSQHNMGEEAFGVYKDMQAEGMVAPDSVTFVSLLQACASVGTLGLEKGKELHAQIREQGLQADAFVANSLVDMYAKCGSLEDARGVFDRLTQKDVVTWNAMIAGYSQQCMGQEALVLYRAMQKEGSVSPNSVTFVCLLQACANVAALHLGRQLHVQIKEQGLQADVLVASSLINMYGKCGSMGEAQDVFDALLESDIVAWNALIAGYACQADSEAVLNLCFRMREDGIQPDGITFLCVLTVCSHTGLVSQGREYFEVMSRQYGITPSEDHCTCMVDLLGRAGQLDEALAFVRTMPVLHGAAVWHALLAACQKWSNVEVGRHAFHEAVKLGKKDAAAYLLMANIYRGAHMWEQAQEIQERRTRIRAWKQPGQSWWADMDGVVHSFLVGDKKQGGSDAW